MQTLTSPTNPKIKLVRSLAQAKGRKAAGLFLVEGPKLLAEALAYGRQPRMTFATASWWQAHGDASPFAGLAGERYEVPESVMAAMATTDTPTPVLAALPLPEADRFRPGPASLVVIAHQLQDPGNLGTIIRSADAAGADAVIVTDQTVDPFSPKVVRATMGGLFHLPVVRMPLPRFAAEFPQVPIFAMTLSGATSIYALDLTGPVAFLVGNEGAGLAVEDEALAAHRLKIPIPGRAESLNAAMAATICLYEAVRQRGAGA